MQTEIGISRFSSEEILSQCAGIVAQQVRRVHTAGEAVKMIQKIVGLSDSQTTTLGDTRTLNGFGNSQ